MKKNPLYKSFGYAFQGISNTIRTERNIKIHCAAAMQQRKQRKRQRQNVR